MASSYLCIGMRDTPDTLTDKKMGPKALAWMMPLHFFYEKLGKKMPELQFLKGEEIPYPYRSLLVHSNDMTPTLAAFHHSSLYLQIHGLEANDSLVMRLVTLGSTIKREAVEFGAIAIQLDGFPKEFREGIATGKKPLGELLGTHGILHHGAPLAYFSVHADELIADALGQRVGDLLYGRCNQLLDSEGMVFADIVEILPRNSESEQWVSDASILG